MNNKYEAVIGLEVHAQLLTETKIFCSCSTKFGNPANSNICPVCLGHPGVLPVLNKKAVEFAVRMGLATNCRINQKSVFARKNYFYPDLPKGYQISQYDLPICENGHIDILPKDGTAKRLGITRIHLEEDAGKSIHDQDSDTLVDVNRCGVPLIEIVSEPDMRSAEDAYLYLVKIKQILEYLGICDGNMEEGSLRCDANISIRPVGQKEFGTKAEVKNMNSFRNVEKAINREIERQTEIIEDGGKIVQQTLLWNADLNEVFPMRSKEEAHDYRYFPEPDLMPVIVSDKWRTEILDSLPELPEARRTRLVSDYSLPEYDAEILTSSKNIADYYETAVKTAKDPKAVSNWVMGDVLKVIKEEKVEISEFPVKPEQLGKLVNLISNNTINGKIAKDVFSEMLKSGNDPEQIVKDKNLVQITDSSLIENAVENAISQNPAEVKEYLAGKVKLIGFFVGKIMQETKGKANPQAVNEILKQKLESMRL